MLYDLFVASSFFTFLHFPFPTLFLAVGFIRPFGASKSYANAFMRYPFVPDCGFCAPL